MLGMDIYVNGDQNGCLYYCIDIRAKTYYTTMVVVLNQRQRRRCDK